MGWQIVIIKLIIVVNVFEGYYGFENIVGGISIYFDNLWRFIVF